jgi:hypothetical protein
MEPSGIDNYKSINNIHTHENKIKRFIYRNSLVKKFIKQTVQTPITWD